jgi:hypothetical protein
MPKGIDHEREDQGGDVQHPADRPVGAIGLAVVLLLFEIRFGWNGIP